MHGQNPDLRRLPGGCGKRLGEFERVYSTWGFDLSSNSCENADVCFIVYSHTSILRHPELVIEIIVRVVVLKVPGNHALALCSTAISALVA